ncbi:ABC transporter substrate-binding protein [Taylorella equigenitalis 14/56]|uniref:ABC transporter substrate-binding protein n=1 Tax=Taylorella equigenitalis 14/56 TaxID=1091497 RepID=I7JN27_9BURK|nr:ABC transporter substrate-binding protein [Taylorella equigenitalis]CCG17398.1 ABC transporter substrate-binding protein [Taylorella equigenitalis 14/56]
MKRFALFALNAVPMMALVSAVWAQQQIRIGVSVSATGPAASLGIPEKNTVEVLEKEFSGIPVEYFVYDDTGDTATAVRNMRKLISENKIDAMIGSSITAPTLAMIDVAAETKTPLVSMVGNNVVVVPVEGPKVWSFKTSPNDASMATALRAAMKKQGIKTLAFIGFADAYGQGWLEQIKIALKETDIKIVAEESYARNDTSVTGQVLKIVSKKPDAVLVATAGTPGALPTRELRTRGFTGQIYHTHGSANIDFLRVCGKACDGVILPAGPVLVGDQLEDSHPSKGISEEYKKLYEAKFGAGSMSTFGAHMFDADLVLKTSMKKVLDAGIKPGSEEFRKALRNAMETSKEVIGTQGVYNMTKDDHTGLDERSRVLVKIENNKWVYQPELLK